jgi:hypothetical protein
MTQADFLEVLEWELLTHGYSIDRAEVQAFTQACWPVIEDDPGDLSRWLAEFLVFSGRSVGRLDFGTVTIDGSEYELEGILPRLRIRATGDCKPPVE